MPRGGARPGAGRKRGQSTKLSEGERKAVAAAGETPLQYMIRVMRDSGTTDARRDEMAKAAAPFMHARLASIEQTTPPLDGSGNQVSALERARRLAFALVEGARQKSKILAKAEEKKLA
jgi:hypothetical protein